ncbi:uncharacterized protein SPSK_01845 [Sporothrix schenckii 1099-18]|uniref:Uncharacterized protein n=1 Tax=Sporothrix schenckii 1099-18 TaxID=1397361 RepID=A0A0F2MF86_SPOSC|nr:uncharacterized protein SPSK_01845 [Sporothrix schenckii 1099-18]KJR87485.1 hypothetical protein SPSK_01845 [Sporothrix schenckii 1099-18]
MPQDDFTRLCTPPHTTNSTNTTAESSSHPPRHQFHPPRRLHLAPVGPKVPHALEAPLVVGAHPVAQAVRVEEEGGGRHPGEGLGRPFEDGDGFVQAQELRQERLVVGRHPVDAVLDRHDARGRMGDVLVGRVVEDDGDNVVDGAGGTFAVVRDEVLEALRFTRRRRTYIANQNHVGGHAGQLADEGVVGGRRDVLVVHDKGRQGADGAPAHVQETVECVHRRPAMHALFGPVRRLRGDRLQIALKVVQETCRRRRPHARRRGRPVPESAGDLDTAPFAVRPGDRRVPEGLRYQTDTLGCLCGGFVVGAVLNDKKDIHQVTADTNVF